MITPLKCFLTPEKGLTGGQIKPMKLSNQTKDHFQFRIYFIIP